MTSRHYSGGGLERITAQGRLSVEPVKTIRGRQESSRAMAELHNMIGLEKIKRLAAELEALVSLQRQRATHNLKNQPLVLHMIFKGNPGTGKTTVARLLGQILCDLEVLPKGHLVEVERADLVGEYIGHTAQKAREKVHKALGGILFIDEAYSLARGGEKDFGKEAVDTLVKAMEDHKNEFVLILAGYTSPMNEFLRLNPGLRSRFPIQLDFPDYSVQQLIGIAHLMLEEREYKLTQRAEMKIKEIIDQRMNFGSEEFSNARLVRNLLEAAIRRHALRLKYVNTPSREQLQTLESTDFQAGDLRG